MKRPKNHIPDKRSDLNGVFAPKSIGHPTRREGTEERTTRHGSCDTTLGGGRDIRTKVVDVLFRSDDGGHRRDVETEQRTAHNSNCSTTSQALSYWVESIVNLRYEIDVPDDIHAGQYVSGDMWERGIKVRLVIVVGFSRGLNMNPLCLLLLMDKDLS